MSISARNLQKVKLYQTISSYHRVVDYITVKTIYLSPVVESIVSK